MSQRYILQQLERWYDCINLIMESYDYKKIVQIMNGKKYREAQFNLDYAQMTQLINSINQAEITQDIFKTIRILIRYFRFPILILFKPFFDRLQKDKEKLMEFIDFQKSIGGIVYKILQGKYFPTLQFYTRAGFTKEGVNLEIGNDQQAFTNFFFGFDNSLHELLKDNAKAALDRLKFMLNQLGDFRRKNKLDPIFQLCNEAFKQLAIERIKQIEGSLQPKPSKIQNSSMKPQKILIQSGNYMRQINDARVASEYLCCRPYFYFNQIINEPETITQQYKNYKYPFNRMLDETLLKTIVGFLNGKGGIIYIGIREDINTKKRTVVGEAYNQALKEDVLKHFRHLGQRIQPQIVNNQLYKLQFVPLRDERDFLPGQYIIRLRISKGQKGQLYCFKNYDSIEYIAFRTQNQVLMRRLNQEILELYRNKLTEPDQPQHSNHSGPCKKPENGRPTYQHSRSSYEPDNRWQGRKASTVSPIYKPKEQINNNQLAYLFVGEKVLTSLKQYYHENYKKIPVVEANGKEQIQLIRSLIETSFEYSQYIPVTLKMTFGEQYFHSIWTKLQQKSILVAPDKSSRESLVFSSLKQSVYAGKTLWDLHIPFQFQMPK